MDLAGGLDEREDVGFVLRCLAFQCCSTPDVSPLLENSSEEETTRFVESCFGESVEKLDRGNQYFGDQLVLGRRSGIVGIVFDAVVVAKLDFFLGDHVTNAATGF